MGVCRSHYRSLDRIGYLASRRGAGEFPFNREFSKLAWSGKNTPNQINRLQVNSRGAVIGNFPPKPGKEFLNPGK